ncbi:MAG: ATP-binding cassette domain-containing protein [Erysipelothrix sp.]|nr:ATP-binding cassette domain-containing protein [Erysipelothrix sp.]
MLRVNHLGKWYGYHKGIEDVSFELKKGEILGVLGHNGSGKTTLFRVLLSLLQPSVGHFEVTQSEKSKNRLFGYIPEERSMYLDITVEQQITYLAKLRKMKSQEIETQLIRWLTFFEMTHERHRIIKELSKGNQQKVQFMCAVIHDPLIIICDEPFNGLDGYNILQLKRAITLLSRLGKIIMLSSHQYEELEEFCHQILLLSKGDVRLRGNLNELKSEDPRRYVTINDDSSQVYKSNEGLVTCEMMGEYSRYVFEDDRYSIKFCEELLRSKDHSYVRHEMISLRDLVMEATS